MEKQKGNASVKWIALGVIVVVLIGIWIFNGTKKAQNPNYTSNASSTSTADVVAAAVAQDHFSVVNIRAENGKFIPDTFTVAAGKVLMINFTGVDGTYDLGFANPKIGFDVVVKKGETQAFGFDTTGKTAGDYVFHCIQYCPKSGTMQGTMTLQ
jgi:hypothetical protein